METLEVKDQFIKLRAKGYREIYLLNSGLKNRCPQWTMIYQNIEKALKSD